jgi:hypothetical protein
MPTTTTGAVLEPPPPAINRLPAPPAALPTTVRALHVLAERVVSPARELATGNEIALRWTPGGFGTPRFGQDQQVRVEGAELVVVGGGVERRGPIGSYRDAVALTGLPAAGGWDEPLDVDDAASRWLGDFYGLAYGALEALRAGGRGGDDPTPVRLWPEHFDIAIEMGDEAAGVRANYGASPGDDDHDGPYVYVGPWTARPQGPAWNARSFPGAELTLGELLATDDHRAAVDAFFARCRAELDAMRAAS